MKIKKLNNILIYLTSLAAVCYAIKDINIGAYDRLIGSLSIILVLLIPKIARKLFKIRITSFMELVYICFIFLAQFLGSVVNLYNTIWWYDLFAHFISGVLTSFLALAILGWFKTYKENNKLFNTIFMICFTLAIACIWEFLEFGAFNILGMDVQHHLTTGVFDTMQDMLVAFLGGVIVAVIYLIENKISKKKLFKKVVSD